MRNPKLRGWIQKLVYPVGEKNVSLLGQAFKIDCQSEVGYYRASIANNSNIFFRDEVPQFISFVAALSPGMIFVDAGTNIGTWTKQIASLGQIVDGLKVVAFEPHPRTFQRLRENCSELNNVQLHNLALSDRNGTLDFFESTTSGVFGVTKSNFNDADESKRLRIAAVTLDDCLGDVGNIALKIDVEGHELEVLRGANGLLARGALRVVFSDGIANESYREFRGILVGAGFKIYNARTRGPESADESYHAIIAVRNADGVISR
ncbi:FkbM family methyltransferase [Methylosinus sp. Sm6]|uniref:FkbM family methyltransferase n=1 Tax=Methylosinus sp. Sm6 TaxID=2866948 RepID=UPI001C99C682|nr:FkbM family methyltransferase [Methylosinus sp. Sm6]MBY6243413.1 FkbM family methyltransferase [Methylosinus sp. Sm6]